MHKVILPPYKIEPLPAVSKKTILELSNWAFQSFEIKRLWQKTRGSHTKVLVIDTGCTHKDIKPFEVKDFTGEGKEDLNGHGTWVSGCIGANGDFKGIAPECTLYVAKALDKNGVGYDTWFKKALEWGLEKDVDVVNISAGSEDNEGEYDDILIDYYKQKKIVVCAAGNESNKVDSPANSQYTLAVGAVNRSWQRASFSDFGPRLTVMAPGVNLLGCYKGDTYVRLSGTSMAAPIVAGVIALKKSITPNFGVEECLEYFKKTCDDIGKPGWDEKTGWGVINPKRFLEIKDAKKEPDNAIVRLLWLILAFLLLKK